MTKCWYQRSSVIVPYSGWLYGSYLQNLLKCNVWDILPIESAPESLAVTTKEFALFDLLAGKAVKVDQSQHKRGNSGLRK